MKRISRLTGLLVSISAAGCVPAVQPLAAATTGDFGFRAAVEGEDFEARFRRFTVVPRIGVDWLPTGFEVEVDIRGIESGDPDLDAEMQSEGWFDSARYPIAYFRSREVGPGPQQDLVAAGELRIKGIERSISVPFSWHRGDDEFVLRGEVALDRRWFGVGPDDESSVAGRVKVFFDFGWHADAP